MDKKIWKDPKQEQSLDEAQTPLWFWNDRLETEELERQLKMQTEIGVKCTDPHARRNKSEGFIGGYLDEKWFEHIKTVIDYKKKHGEKMWLYDEIDWPAGTCGQTVTLNENNREKYITIQTFDVPAGETFRAQLRTFEGKGLFGIRPDTDRKGIAFNIHVTDQHTMEELPIDDFLIFDRFGPEFEFKADRDCTVFLTKINADLYDCGGNGQVSYLNADATRQFLASTYDKYYDRFPDAFGSIITAVFDDETRMCHPIPWSSEFADVFREKKGYDIRQELFRLILPGEKAGRIRCDYFDVLAWLYQHNYFGVLHEWCENHGIGLFAHLLGEETMFGHTRYSGDYLRQNRYQDICGVDHLGKGIGSLNVKFAACGSHSYGKKRSAVEVFAGCGWDMTFEEYIRIITWMYQMGMQIIINHGFFYSDRGERKNDWPPSQFFQWQGWNRQSEGNDMIRRLHYALTDGINEADILVYFPLETFWYYYIPDQNYTHGFFHGPFLQDQSAVRLDTEIQTLLNGLLSHNLDFDLIHRDAVENFRTEGKEIVNCASGQSFRVLILPECEVLPVEAARLCEKFAQAGGKVIFAGSVPKRALDSKDDEELSAIMERMTCPGRAKYLSMDTEKICDFLKREITCPIKIVKGTCGTANNHSSYPAYLIDPYMHGGEDLTGIMFTRYLKDGKRNTLFMNYSSHPETIEVMVRGKDEIPEIWDTFTGEIQKAQVTGIEKDGYRIRLNLPCHYGMIVVSEL